MPEPRSFSQKPFKTILPAALFEDMCRESMNWMMQCSNCKHETSIWNLEGIAWKAAGTPKDFQTVHELWPAELISDL